jgi:hypothetical protein
MMEVVPFITGARCQVMSQLMIDYWAISEQGWADGAVHCLRFSKDGNHHFKSVNMGNCMHCREFLCISSIQRHQEVCPCNPEYQHKIQGHLRQQKRLQKYTPSQNDVILQSDLQRRNKESYPELNGNVILEDLIRTHSASYKMARQGSKERTEVADKTMKKNWRNRVFC